MLPGVGICVWPYVYMSAAVGSVQGGMAADMAKSYEWERPWLSWAAMAGESTNWEDMSLGGVQGMPVE